MIHPPKCVSQFQPIAMIAFLIGLQFAKNPILLCADSMHPSIAQKTNEVIDQPNNVVIKMKQPGNGGNLENRLLSSDLPPMRETW